MLAVGLDVSTSIVGVVALTWDDVVLVDHVDLRTCGTFWERVERVRGYVSSDSFAPVVEAAAEGETVVAVEEALQSFRSGFSSAHTLSLLSKMNACTALVVRDVLDIDPCFVSSTSARAKCGLKLRRPSTPEERADRWFVKRQVLDHVVTDMTERGFEFEWPRTRPSSRYPDGRLADACYDIADAYIVASAILRGVDVKVM